MAGEVQKTINYFQFKIIAGNRKIDPKHVNELVEDNRVKNKFHLFPMLINSKMEVVDGQHRLAAAEILQCYVHYIIDDTINENDIASVNLLSKNWSINDYIHFYLTKNKPGFDKLVAFMIDNPLLPVSTVMMMLSSGRRRDTAALKRGEIDVSKYESAVEMAKMVKEYFNLVPFAYERSFVLAVMNCYLMPGYDHQEMKRQLESQSRCVVKCINIKQYMEMFSEIYNRGKSKNILKFDF